MRSTRSLFGIPISLANSYTRIRGPATAGASPPPEDSDLRSNPLPIILFHSCPGREKEVRDDDSNRVASQNKCHDRRGIVRGTTAAKGAQEAAARQRRLHTRLARMQRGPATRTSAARPDGKGAVRTQGQSHQ